MFCTNVHFLVVITFYKCMYMCNHVSTCLRVCAISVYVCVHGGIPTKARSLCWCLGPYRASGAFTILLEKLKTKEA